MKKLTIKTIITPKMAAMLLELNARNLNGTANSQKNRKDAYMSAAREANRTNSL